jgi:hypothetical protein
MDILDIASKLATPPKSGALSAWFAGVGAAFFFVLCGTYCLITSHAWVLNIGVRGMARGAPGLLREVFGRQATALGFALIGIGMFANIHWFWPRSERLSRYAEVAKAMSLIVIIAATSWWIYESL